MADVGGEPPLQVSELLQGVDLPLLTIADNIPNAPPLVWHLPLE
jgi:hypothetical protein